MKILLHGCNGRMGRVITRLVEESQVPEMQVVCGVDMNPGKLDNTYPVFPSLKEVPADIRPDVVIDFSHPSSVVNLLDFGLSRHVPLVIGTSGIAPEQRQKISDAAQKIPVLMSANMSLGISLVLSLVAQAAQVLGKSFDIEIVEKHHSQKIDAPSGTAVMIADAINAALGNSMDYVYGRRGDDESQSASQTRSASMRCAGNHRGRARCHLRRAGRSSGDKARRLIQGYSRVRRT